jgi:hypothetical protein
VSPISIRPSAIDRTTGISVQIRLPPRTRTLDSPILLARRGNLLHLAHTLVVRGQVVIRTTADLVLAWKQVPQSASSSLEESTVHERVHHWCHTLTPEDLLPAISIWDLSDLNRAV